MRKLIFKYLKFLWLSQNQHSVHSPFVYQLITDCFYDKKKHSNYSKLKTYRNTLLTNQNEIDVTDMGVGSILKDKRRISNIVKNASSTPYRTRLLYRLTKYVNAKTILELGTSTGIATHAMALAKPKATITTIEGCPNISTFTKTNFEKEKLDNITILTGHFDRILPQCTATTASYDLIYIDGNHKKEATYRYFETLLSSVHNNSVIIFDDIYWSKGMEHAWHEIINHPKVTVSIDTFYWGIIFFRKEQKKEHFTIRL